MKIGDVIEGKYELLRLLGEGGMGSVYEATHRRIGHRVALKFLHPELAGRQEILSRFLREAKAAAAIGSEHIVQITDLSETDDGIPYLVMEYLDGLNLAALLEQQGILSPTRASTIILQVCRALELAHERGIVHRDLKPENIMLIRREDGAEWVKVLDFGIAKFHDKLSVQATKLTATGSTLGTPFYMAPEQLRESKDVDRRADIYSTGVILYELLTGARSHVASTFGDLIIKVATSDPAPLRELHPEIDEALERAVLRAMDRDMGARSASMAELAAALEPHAGGRPLTTPVQAASSIPQTMIVESFELPPAASSPLVEEPAPIVAEPPPDDEPAPPPETIVLPASGPEPAPPPETIVLPASGPEPAPPPETIVLPASGPEPAPPPETIVLPASGPEPAPAMPPVSEAPAGEPSGSAVKRWVVGIVFGATVAGIAVLIMSIATRSDDDEPTHGEGHEDQALVPLEAAADAREMTIHVMSQCPYGVKVVQAITPVARKLGNRFKLNLAYIGRDEDGVLTSMHGDSEVAGDKLQLCVHEHGSYIAWLAFMECQNESWRGIPEGWEQCARDAGVGEAIVRTCFQGDEGTRMLRASFEASQEAGARGSPTIFLNGERYAGGRTERAFAQAICVGYEDPRPPHCRDLPEPPAVPVTVLVDRRCKRQECDVSAQVKAIKSTIPGAKVSQLDYATREGRRAYEKAELRLLPAILIGRELQQDPDAFRALRGLKRHDDVFVSQLGRFDPTQARWIPRPEVRIRYLLDSRCHNRECQAIGRFKTFIKRQVPNAKSRDIDYATHEGRTLWFQVAEALKRSKSKSGASQPPGLPVAIFGPRIVEEEEAYSRLSRRLVPMGDQHLFQLGPWDPTAEYPVLEGL